ncbi:hypothetical protein ONZ45_g14678 [Pleurotus djamor]|nr:hypothetical protein ONZ45_g14678 [Pleurotus djamor]
MLPCPSFRCILALCLSSYFLPVALAIKGDSWCGFHLCVNATVDEFSVNYQLTAKSQAVGWMAIGFGKRMINSHMVIVWKNHSNRTSISQRITEQYREPHTIIYPPRRATVDDVTDFWAPPGWQSLAFRIPKNTTVLPQGHTSEPYIWAVSNVQPSGGDADETLHMHYAQGHFELDLTKDLPEAGSDVATIPAAPTRPVSPPKETMSSRPSISKGDGAAKPNTHVAEPHKPAPVVHESPYEKHDKLVLLHGVLLSAGFLVFLPLATLVARWGRTITEHWFKVHWIFNMLVGVPVVTLGWLLGPLAVMNRGSGHFRDAHQICGFVLYALFLVQVFLGRRIQSRPPNHDGPAHPPSNIIHMVFGLTILGFAVFQTHSGLNEWESSLSQSLPPVIWRVWQAWVIILPIIYLVGFAFLPKQLALERSGAQVIPGNYIALSDRPEETPARWNEADTVVFNAPVDSDDIADSRRSEHSVPLLRAGEA